MDNSIKAGADHIQVSGRVEMTESAASGQRGNLPEPRYIIQFEDNGCGIPAQEIRRITEAFYMVEKSRSRKMHGAGIGLALSERIARIHGSRLEFESDGKSGTKVKICLKCKGVVGGDSICAAGNERGNNDFLPVCRGISKYCR